MYPSPDNPKKLESEFYNEHYFLGRDDVCYFYLDYIPNDNYQNSFINNLKKSVEKRGTQEYSYKIWAIRKMSECLRASVENELFEELKGKSVIFVPVPPSKSKEDPLYDDRLVSILNNSGVCCKELIRQSKSRESCHVTGGASRNIEEIYNNYTWNENESPDGEPEVVVVFDDVLTTGAHFKACQRMIKEHYPRATTIGVFVASRRIDDCSDDFPFLEEPEDPISNLKGL